MVFTQLQREKGHYLPGTLQSNLHNCLPNWRVELVVHLHSILLGQPKRNSQYRDPACLQIFGTIRVDRTSDWE